LNIKLAPSRELLAHKIQSWIEQIASILGTLYLLLIAVIVLQIILRKGFSNGMVAFEELQWHLYAITMMFGLAYVETVNANVRVDIISSRLSSRTRSLIEIVGLTLLIVPFILIVLYHSLDFVETAWRIGENSNAPGGLPFRWVIKSVIPASFLLWLLAILARLHITWLEFKGSNKHGH